MIVVNDSGGNDGNGDAVNGINFDVKEEIRIRIYKVAGR